MPPQKELRPTFLSLFVLSMLPGQYMQKPFVLALHSQDLPAICYSEPMLIPNENLVWPPSSGRPLFPVFSTVRIAFGTFLFLNNRICQFCNADTLSSIAKKSLPAILMHCYKCPLSTEIGCSTPESSATFGSRCVPKRCGVHRLYLNGEERAM